MCFGLFLSISDQNIIIVKTLKYYLISGLSLPVLSCKKRNPVNLLFICSDNNEEHFDRQEYVV